MPSAPDEPHAPDAPAADDAPADDAPDTPYRLTPHIARCLQAPLVPQRSDEWFRLRTTRITGSIVDTILGTNPFNSYETLVLEKAGMPTTFHGNEATRHGTLMEPVAIAAYERATGRRVRELGLTPHPTVDVLAHSPDGIALSTAAAPVLLEVKCPLRRKIENKVPKYYMGQLQLGLEVFDLDRAHFVQYRDEPRELVITVVDREPGWLQRHMPKFEAFWADVQEWKARGWREHPSQRRAAGLDFFRRHCVLRDWRPGRSQKLEKRDAQEDEGDEHRQRVADVAGHREGETGRGEQLQR